MIEHKENDPGRGSAYDQDENGGHAVDKGDNIVSFKSGNGQNIDHKSHTPDRHREILLSKALSVSRFRKTRDSIFKDSELFFDPTWDMILELYIAYLQRVRISVSALCISQNGVVDIAYRWLNILEAKQIVTIVPDGEDHRRSFVSLNQITVNYVNTLLSAYP